MATRLVEHVTETISLVDERVTDPAAVSSDLVLLERCRDDLALMLRITEAVAEWIK